MAQIGQRVKTVDGSKAGLHPTGNQGTILSINLANKRMYGSKFMTLDEVLVQFDGRMQPIWQVIGGLV